MIDHRQRIEKSDPRFEGKFSGIETRLVRPDREITINGYHIEEFCSGETAFVLVNGWRVNESYKEAIEAVTAYFRKGNRHDSRRKDA